MEKFKYLYKRLIWNVFNIHNNWKKDIFVLTTCRSGGTWLTEMIGTSNGVRFCQEPLSYNLIYHPRINSIRNLQKGELFVEGEGDLSLLRDYIRDIQQGSTKVQLPFRMNRPYFHFKTDRTVFKVSRGLSLIRFLDKIYQVISCII